MMISHIFAIVLAIMLFTIPQLKFPKFSKLQLKLLLTSILGMAWTVTEFVSSYFFFDNTTILYIERISFALSIAMFVTLLFFISAYLKTKWNKILSVIFLLYTATAMFLTVFTDSFTQGIFLNDEGLYQNIPGIGYYPILALILITIFTINILLLKEIFKKDIDTRRKKIIKILFFFTSFPPLLGIAYNLVLPVLGMTVTPIAHATYALTAIGFIHVIYKYGAFGIKHSDIPIWTKIYYVINSISIIVIFLSFFTYYEVASKEIKTSTENKLHIKAYTDKSEIETQLSELVDHTNFIDTRLEDSSLNFGPLEIFSSEMISTSEIYDVIIIDNLGVIKWSKKSEEQIKTNINTSKYQNTILQETIIKVQLTGEYSLSDYSFYEPSNQKISFLAIPKIIDGKVSDIVVLKLDQDYFTKYLSSHSSQPRTFLIQEDYDLIYPINPNNTENNTFTKSAASEACFNKDSIYSTDTVNTYTYANTNKTTVIALPLQLDSNNWCIILEHDETSAMQGLNDLLYAFAYFSVVISTLIATSAFIIGKRLAAPLSNLSKELSQLNLAKTTKKLSVDRKDEVGQLTEVFNELISNLKVSQVDVMRKVHTQTAELNNSQSKLEEQQLAIMNIMQDIEIEKESTANQRDRLDIILKSIGDGVFVVDKDLNVILINHQAIKISGYTTKEVLNKPYKDNIKFVSELTNEPVESFITDAIESGETTSMPNKTMLITKTGNYIPVADSAAPLKNDQGEIMGCVIIFRDITSEKELDEMKTEFLSVAAHQLRTPLGSMRWNIEMLISGDIGELSKPTKEILEQVYNSNQRMAMLVDDLLNTSRIDQERIDDKPVETDIIHIIKDAITEIEPIAKQRSVTVSLNLEEQDYSKILLDPKKFREVIQNLLSNGVKYNKENGTVDIFVAKKDSSGLTISIKDTGMGIPKKDQQKLFSKFFRADNAVKSETEGSGLGLFVVKSYIEDWGGTIKYESEEGKGTTFTIFLPNNPDRSKLNINLRDKPQTI